MSTGPTFRDTECRPDVQSDLLLDYERIRVAEEHIREEQLLEAARILRQIDNDDVLTAAHRRLLHKAMVIEDSVQELLVSPSSSSSSSSPSGGVSNDSNDNNDNNDDDDTKHVNGWTKQGESHGDHDFTIYYKVDTSSGSAKLTCRIESPIPRSLLVPLLSVLNESDLYETWIPSWQRPFKLGIRSSKQILHDTRGHQVIQVICDVPWPLSPREALFDVQAVDDIESRGFILAKMTSITTEMAKKDLPSSFVLPDMRPGTERAEFDGSVLIRACPTDHPCYDISRSKIPQHEDLVLVQFCMYFDAHMTMVPQSMINFITRSVIGVIWSMLLNVAEQVRDGTRQGHCNVIAQKAGFYTWVEERVVVLLDKNRQNTRAVKGRREEMRQTTPTVKSSTPMSSDEATLEASNHREKHTGVHPTSPPMTMNPPSPLTEPWTLQEVLRLSI